MTESLTINCPLCGCTEGTAVLWGEEMVFHLPGRIAVVRCGQCTFHQSWPPLTLESLRKYYPAEYYGETPRPQPIRHHPFLLRLGRHLHRIIRGGRRISYLACVVPPSWIDLALPAQEEPGKLLDIGAGWGRFVAAAMSMGWKAEAVDFGDSILDIGKVLNIPVYRGTLEENLYCLSGGYDLISMNHVLEHLPSPLEALQTARALLNDGGVVRIQVPLWRPSFLGVFGKYWSPLDLPRHRWHFRPGDIGRLAAQAGFDRVLFLPETATSSLVASLRLWVRNRPTLRRWQHLTSVDNRVLRAALFPTGCALALLRRPFEATFYLMKA